MHSVSYKLKRLSAIIRTAMHTLRRNSYSLNHVFVRPHNHICLMGYPQKRRFPSPHYGAAMRLQRWDTPRRQGS